MYQRNADTLNFSREQSHRAWQAWNRRQADIREKTCLFSDLQGARYYLKDIRLSIQEACEYDRLLLTLPCVVDLLLESSEATQWIIAEHQKIINDPNHRSKTEQIDGFIYEGGFFKLAWWKLFGKGKQHYTSGYQNRIAEIVAHIEEEKEEQVEKENEEQKIDQDETSTNIDKLDDNKIKHIIEGSKDSDHKWEKLVRDKNWQEIKKIIKEVMETGTEESYKSVKSKIKMIKGHIVEVVYNDRGGIKKISNAWIK